MERITYLWQQYLTNRASKEEVAELLDLVVQAEDVEQHARLAASLSAFRPMEDYDPEKWQFLVDTALQAGIKKDSKRPVRMLRQWWWAASLLLMLAAGAYIWVATGKNAQQAAAPSEIADIGPGKEGAILILADGTQIVLDSLQNGAVAMQNGTQIWLNNGLLAYNPSEKVSSEVSYNTVRTPNGAQYQLALPDGSKVWLNAGSSVTFPTVFTGKTRSVEITGEAYLQVVKDETQPFIAKAGSMEIQVLGTSFNVNAYTEEEEVKTTLEEGSVKVSNGKEAVVLLPGQQSAGSENNLRVNRKVDIEQELAWKFGLFNFQDKTLPEVMRQLARWYDLDVQYEKEIPNIRFIGGMSRTEKLSSILKGLEESGVHFRQEDNRRVIVLSSKS